jgi:NarL family two-component system response regulator YdfI
MIKLVIVDDHQIIRAGLELMFETMDDIEVLGTG